MAKFWWNEKDETTGCACKNNAIQQDKGTHIIELFENTQIPSEIWWADMWYKCSNCKANIIVGNTKILLHKSTDNNFELFLESIQDYQHPIYNYFQFS